MRMATVGGLGVGIVILLFLWGFVLLLALLLAKKKPGVALTTVLSAALLTCVLFALPRKPPPSPDGDRLVSEQEEKVCSIVGLLTMHVSCIKFLA